jgi:hypothetical protein
MKESAIYEHLSQLAEGLHVKISNVVLSKSAYNTRSGLCKVRGKHRVILDKHLQLSEKIDVLIDALQQLEIDLDTVDPFVRKFFKKKARPAQPSGQQPEP